MPGSLAGVSCLVTGAGGFLGQRIVEMLLEEEEAFGEIRMLDVAFSPRLRRTCDQYQGKTKLQLLRGDILDGELLQRACQGVTVVIHTAALIDPIGTVPKEKLMAVNVTGTQMLLEACIEMNVKYFIFTSTLEVVGPNSRGDPVFNGNEDLVYHSSARSFPYAESKRKAEQSVLMANGQRLNNGSSLMTCSLRPMYIFGEEGQFLKKHLQEAINNNDLFRRYSRKEALANPVYVGNAAWAHIQAAKAMTDPEQVSQVAGQFYFISDDTPHMSYSDFNYELGKEIGFGVEPKPRVPFLLLYTISYLLEIIRILLSPFVNFVPPINRTLISLFTTPFSFSYKKACRDFGYKPRYTWADAKRFTAQWMAEQVSQSNEYQKHHNQR